MKHFFYILLFATLICACSRDNSSVRDVCEIIKQGASKEFLAANGKEERARAKTLDQTKYFIIYDCIIFSNPQVAARIRQDKNHELTGEDKEMLLNAIEFYFQHNKKPSGEKTYKDIGERMDDEASTQMYSRQFLHNAKKLEQLFYDDPELY